VPDPCTVDAVILEWLERSADAANGSRPHRNQIRIAPHHADRLAIGADLDDVAGEKDASSFSAVGPMRHGAAFEVTAASNQRDANVMKDWGRSDNDQRHRLVVSASVNSPMTHGTTTWEHISHGFQASTMLQYYSSLPFNIVSGVNSLQGTAGRPFADGSVSTANFDVRQVEFIPRNAGTGSDFFTLSLRVSRSFRLAGVLSRSLIRRTRVREPR
jgi:hypothetical protein